MKAAAPVFYFSLRSPYSWLAWHDLATHHPALLASLDLRPFWEPDDDFRAELGAHGETFLYTAMSKEKHLYILTDIKRLAQKRGLPVAWPQDKTPRWEVPHLAYFVAKQAGMGREYIAAITKMRWQAGRDICNPDTVEEVGRALGVAPGAMRNAHLDPPVRVEGLQALRACIEGGVFGVPFFLVGREKFWGIDRLQDFVGRIGRAAPPIPAVVPATEAPNRALHDHAGGCG